ncbi:sensor domain-containing diguanylate cyclase [Edaphobacter modestus]|uniref:diguanylate cyclase n=1 Tax=Edaphobacter modestus TaxID=388466 RepID=A0A4Q7YNM5_9BACT|nr:diguanylate cyclase [Edaphobacter modestus]RZU38948.1 diguanylate cyclase (GGDEF)-like protein [Edaphobacter modestus]
MDKLPKSTAAIKLILLAALGSVLFTTGGAIFLFRNTQNLISAGRWAEHTREVLLSIQTASDLTQRTESGSRFYRVTQDEVQLSNSRRNTIQLRTRATRLRSLVADNTHQTSNLNELDTCSTALLHDLSTNPPDLVHAEAHVLHCQQTLSLMAGQEQELLKQRDETTQRRSQISTLTELGLAGICFSTMIVLFSLLLRDAILRGRVVEAAARTNQELSNSVHSLRNHGREVQLLSLARDDLQLCTDAPQVHRSAAFRFSELLSGTNGSLCIINSSRNMVETVSSWSANDTNSGIAEIFPPETCCGLRSGQFRWHAPGASQIDCNHFIGSAPRCYLCVPLVAHGDTIGILYIGCPDEAIREIVESRTEGVRQLVQLTAMALASLEMRKKLEHQSIRDGLTSLFNRHFLEIALERELARASRRKGALSVLMMDIDHFKKLNDQFGHSAGDAVLKEIAHTFSACVRTEDLICRYGGEEFTIILPDITPEATLHRAEVIRKAVANLRTELDNDLYSSVTVSIGAAIFPRDGQSSESLLRHADAALYRAKREGRNRVVMVEDSSPASV